VASGLLLRIYLECNKEGVTRSDVILRERSPEHSEGEATEESNDEARFRAEPVLSAMRLFAEPVLSAMTLFAEPVLSVMRFFAEPVLSVMRFFATLRMTVSEGLRMTVSEGLRMTVSEGLRMTVSEGLRMTGHRYGKG